LRIGTKLAGLLGTIVLVSMLTFLLTQLLPGDPVVSVLGSSYDNKTPTGQAQIAVVRKELGLDKSLPLRYVDWAGKVVRGDLGRSFGVNSGGIKTTRLLKERFPITLELMLLTQVVAIALAVPLGVYSAYRQGKLLDKIITWGSFATLSLPGFVVALILVYVFAVKLRWLPTGGYTRLTDDLAKNLKSVVIPVLTLSLGLAAVYARLIRSEMVSTLQEDYILMARAKGLPDRYVLFRHALKPSSFSLLTVIGIQIGALIGGSVIVEFLMSMPGIGLALIDSVGQREYQVVLGLVLVITAFYVGANFVVDLLYSFLDPRIRRGSTRN
jgi:peptide/nickel transport system permease protein